MAASTTARASGLSRIRYSVIPPPMSCPHDSTVSPRCRSSISCKPSGRGRTGPAGPAGPGGPPAAAVDLAHGDQAGGDGVDRARLQQRGQLPQLGGDHAAGGHRQPALLHRARAAAGQGATSSLDGLGDQAGVAGVQGRAPVGDPLLVDPACEEATSPRSTASAVSGEPARSQRPPPAGPPPAAPRPGRVRSAGAPVPAGRTGPRWPRTGRRPARRRRSASSVSMSRP
jgi:hypothetical protein